MAVIALIRLFLVIFASLFETRARLEAENTARRQQLIVQRRKLTGRVGLTNGGRMFFGRLYRLFPSVAGVMLLADPRPLSAGTAQGFDRIGAESLGAAWVARRPMTNCVD